MQRSKKFVLMPVLVVGLMFGLTSQAQAITVSLTATNIVINDSHGQVNNVQVYQLGSGSSALIGMAISGGAVESTPPGCTLAYGLWCPTRPLDVRLGGGNDSFRADPGVKTNITVDGGN